MMRFRDDTIFKRRKVKSIRLGRANTNVRRCKVSQHSQVVNFDKWSAPIHSKDDVAGRHLSFLSTIHSAG